MAFARLMLLLVSTLLLIACPPAGPGRETITILGEDSSNLLAYQSLGDDFTAESGITVEFEGATFEQAVQKADADFRSGRGDYDIILQYNFSLAPYVKNDYVIGIDEVTASGTEGAESVLDGMFSNALMETCFYYSDPEDLNSAPKQFGFPFAANTMMLVYNRDIFEDAGLQAQFRSQTGAELAPPREWAEFLTIAEFISSTRPDLKGVCLQGAADGWLYYEICNFLFSMGTGTSSKQYGWQEGAPLTIDTPGNQEVLRFYKRLKAVSSGDFFTVGASQQREIMLQGKTAMAIMWSDYIQPLADSSAPRFGFEPIPGKVSGLAGGAFYINKNSKHVPAASRFVLYALSPEIQTRLVERGLCSALKTAYTDDVMTRVPWARAMRDSLERGIFMFEAGSDAEIINTALTTWVQRYVRGDVSEGEALAKAQEEILAKKMRLGQ